MSEPTSKSQIPESNQWQYQLRVKLADEVAQVVRCGGEHPGVQSLKNILAKHKAILKCQYDVFADYCTEAEERGVDKYPLYAWTKATIEDPAKKAKYIQSFTIYINGQEVYAREKADGLEVDLQPMAGGEVVTALSKHDTNPKNNPQPPQSYRPQS